MISMMSFTFSGDEWPEKNVQAMLMSDESTVLLRTGASIDPETAPINSAIPGLRRKLYQNHTVSLEDPIRNPVLQNGIA